jgi:hypothetical protein
MTQRGGAAHIPAPPPRPELVLGGDRELVAFTRRRVPWR